MEMRVRRSTYETTCGESAGGTTAVRENEGRFHDINRHCTEEQKFSQHFPWPAMLVCEDPRIVMKVSHKVTVFRNPPRVKGTTQVT